MIRKTIQAVFLAGCCLATSVAASTYVVVGDQPLAEQAELIARVQFVGQRVSDASGTLSTYYDAVVEELVKGSVAGSRLEVRVPGGRSAVLGRELMLHGVPEFSSGDRALLFLRSNADGTYRVLHLLQGAFTEARHAGRTIFVRDITEEPQLVAASSGGVTLAVPARESERFIDWLRDLAAGRRRPADYFSARPDGLEPKVRASFTHLSTKIQLRWFEFDQTAATDVLWFRHVSGQAGLEGGGKNEFSRALSAWRTQTGTSIRLTDAGTTTSTLGFGPLDGQNTILFEDVNEIVGDDYDCETGGVIAIGGVNGYYTTEASWKDQAFFPIAEAEIIVNDGTACLFEESPKLAGQIYAHELGHTLGLGHACGDSKSPKCSSSELLNSALMRASARDRKGAELSDDDITGARFLYDPEFFAVPCDLPPGHRKFCRRCGPCGEGQGGCKKSSHCLDGLECAKNVGEDFGLKPKANVCVLPD